MSKLEKKANINHLKVFTAKIGFQLYILNPV